MIQSRKEFLRNSLSLMAGIHLMGQPSWLLKKKNAVDLTFDLHAHPGQLYKVVNGQTGADSDAVKAFASIEDNRLGGLFLSLVADSKLLVLGEKGVSVSGQFQPGEGWAEYQRQIGIVREFLHHSTVRIANSAADLTANGTAAFLAVEGGHFLEGDAGKLAEAYADGIRSVQLVHYAPNELGDLQTWEEQFHGLSAAGKEVVRKMNQLGMLIDVAHASYETTRQVAMLSQDPIMLSHSVLSMESDRPIAQRAITKQHARVVADTGGLIGMWPSGFNRDFDEFVENTKRMVDVVGIDHVGIGTDMDANYKPVLTSYSEFPDLSQALMAKGLTGEEVAKIMGNNAARVIRQVIG
ncbi:MAG: membrane dipeptidase [Saprospiraceae bacterium]